MGILDAYLYDGSSDATLFRAVKDTADYLVSLGGNGYAYDIIFLVKFGALTGDPTYTNEAQAMWDRKFVSGGGTYNNATEYAEYIRDLRAGQGYENGIIPWGIAGYVRAAQDLHDALPGNGYDTDADNMAEVVYQDVFNDSPYGYFDIEDDIYEYWTTSV